MMFAIIYLLGTFIADLFKSRRRLEVENPSFPKIRSGLIRLVRQNHRTKISVSRRTEQSNERTTKQSEQLDHRATASPDSHRFASYMEFPTGTGIWWRPVGVPFFGMTVLKQLVFSLAVAVAVVAAAEYAMWILEQSGWINP